MPGQRRGVSPNLAQQHAANPQIGEFGAVAVGACGGAPPLLATWKAATAALGGREASTPVQSGS